MRKVLAGAIFCGLTCGSAWAAAYDDFVRAGELRRVGNVDGALAAYSAALSAGDLAPAYVPDAYAARAQLYIKRGQCALALTDLDAALLRRPALLDGLRFRAAAHDCLGQNDEALADLDALVAAAPSGETYTLRGLQHWARGHFDHAADDFAKTVSLHSARSFEWQPASFSLAWYAISAQRAGRFALADFKEKANTLKLDRWPGPVVSFFLGDMTQDELYQEAGKGEKDLPKFHKCDVDFFLGAWRIGAGDVATGKTLLKAVETDCPRLTAARAATADLHRIP